MIRILNSSFISNLSNPSSKLTLDKIRNQKFSKYKNYSAGLIEEQVKAESDHAGDLVEKLGLIVAADCLKDFKNKKVGINIGSARGATETWEKLHQDFLDDRRIPAGTSPLTTAGRLSSVIAQRLRLEGVSFSHSITCSTGLHSILNACAWLTAGYSEYFVAGAAEACVNDFTIRMIDSLGIYSKSGLCQPFNSANQNSFILSEAAGVILLGKSDHGIGIAGFGVGLDPTNSLTGITEEGVGFQTSMKEALAMAKLDTVDLVIAHAPGTTKGDQAEYNAIKSVFNKLPNIISTKFYSGHSFATSGLLSIELAQLVLDTQEIPEFNYANYIKNSKSEIKTIMVNAAGFGGNTVSIILAK